MCSVTGVLVSFQPGNVTRSASLAVLADRDENRTEAAAAVQSEADESNGASLETGGTDRLKARWEALKRQQQRDQEGEE